MPRFARVTSIDALQAMSAALECFHADASNALDELGMQIRRALQWINHDCRDYWAQEVRRGFERVAEARVQLQQALTFRRVGEHQPSCVDEKKALEKAKRRLQTAQSKVQAIRHWAVVIERAVNEYRGSRAGLVNWLDADLPQAVAALKRMREALESYVALEPPADEMAPIAWLAPEPLAGAGTAGDELSQESAPAAGESAAQGGNPPAAQEAAQTQAAHVAPQEETQP